MKLLLTLVDDDMLTQKWQEVIHGVKSEDVTEPGMATPGLKPVLQFLAEKVKET